MRLRVNDKYFSPNGDSKKDSVQVEVIDDEGRDWELLVKRNGTVHKMWMGNGSTFIDRDGMGGSSQVLPEGKYEFVIRTVEKRDRVRDREQVVLDVTPPEVNYYINQTSLESGQLKVVVKDNLSKIDGEVVITSTNNPVTPGIPQLQGKSKDTVYTNQGQNLFYDLLFPIFSPDDQGFQTQANSDFSIQSENENSDTFAIAQGITTAGISFQVALAPKSTQNLLDKPCQSSGGNFNIPAVFDADPNGPDLTLFIFPSSNNKIKTNKNDIQGLTISSESFNMPIPSLFDFTLSTVNQMKDKFGKPSKIGLAAYNTYQRANSQKSSTKRQQKINEAFDILARNDATLPSTIHIGYNQASMKNLLDFYAQGKSKTLFNMIKYGLGNKGLYAPYSSKGFKNGAGYGYFLSADLDKKVSTGPNGQALSAYSETPIGGKVELTLQVKGETIQLELTKVNKNQKGVNWSVSCK